MPHDISGQPLREGDEVLIRARVVRIDSGDNYCNVSLETVQPMYPGEHKSAITLNTRQVEKV